MQDITLQTYLKRLRPATEANGSPAVEKAPGEGFGKLLKDAIGTVNDAQLDADDAARDLLSGRSGNLHETTIALEKAEISLKLMVQVRNKVLEAYNEIMRMQV